MNPIQIVAIIFIVWFLFHLKKDDTDGSTERSGMILYTDHKTGVQYVGTLWGGITPRLNADGTPHVIERTTK